MSGNQRKEHHSHETTDAFADGWDARLDARYFPASQPVNPYRAEVELIAARGTKRSARQVAARVRNVELWDQGWKECDEDVTKGAKSLE